MKKVLQLLLVYIAFSASAQTPLFINEFHYDNADADVNEFVELAGPAGTDLDAAVYQLEFYSVDSKSKTETLSGSLSDNGCGFGFYSINISGIQNGPNDAIALVKDGAVVQFISYEGTVTAIDGSAIGLTSTDIGVAEDGTSVTGTLSTESLQLTGSGTDYEDFTWVVPAANTKDAVNNGQTLEPITTNEISFDNATITELESAGIVSVILNLDAAATNDGTVTVSIIDNTTVTGIDYTTTVSVINITKGQTSVSFDVTISDDASVEADETFTATISATSCLISIGTVNSTTFTITDNDTAPVGVNEVLENKIQVFPNPTNGFVNIINPKNETIEVFNSVGKLVTTSKENKINLDKGVYLLKMGGFSKRVIVE